MVNGQKSSQYKVAVYKQQENTLTAMQTQAPEHHWLACSRAAWSCVVEIDAAPADAGLRQGGVRMRQAWGKEG